ncbi:hypothetical protein CEXT_495561 [Caerostris extrusa]|uniref:Uncharacterized protein n=1 Tax=Caerostris extrusa TaxID=172846 RepID=A0AAV4Q2U6_CAEEX|nr:hypothetical protein CEXT_495561 [Caerostris extrusa]
MFDLKTAGVRNMASTTNRFGNAFVAANQKLFREHGTVYISPRKSVFREKIAYKSVAEKQLSSSRLSSLIRIIIPSYNITLLSINRQSEMNLKKYFP